MCTGVCSPYRSIFHSHRGCDEADGRPTLLFLLNISQKGIRTIHRVLARHMLDFGQRVTVSAVTAWLISGPWAAWIKAGAVSLPYHRFNDGRFILHCTEEHSSCPDQFPWPCSNSITSTGLRPSSMINSATCSRAKCSSNPC